MPSGEQYGRSAANETIGRRRLISTNRPSLLAVRHFQLRLFEFRKLPADLNLCTEAAFGPVTIVRHGDDGEDYASDHSSIG